MEKELSRDLVLKRDIPWETYMTAKLINQNDLQLLRRYDHRPNNVQAALLEEDGVSYIRVFVGIVRDISKQETVEYMLAMVDEMLAGLLMKDKHTHLEMRVNKAICAHCGSQSKARTPFSRQVIPRQSRCLPAFLEAATKEELVHSGEKLHDSHSNYQGLWLGYCSARPSEEADNGQSNEVLRGLVDWLVTQLKTPTHPTRGVPTAVSSLAVLLRIPKMRAIFVRADGIRYLSLLIVPASNQQYIQLLYEATLCMWLLSFHDGAAEAFSTAKVLPQLVEVVKNTAKEKVVRVAIFAFSNLASHESLVAEMVDLGMPKVVQSLKLQAWSDEDLAHALEVVDKAMKECIQKMSSFEQYKSEVQSGNLEWSPMHKDAVFWRENVCKFEENNYQVLRILIAILDKSTDAKALSVACHDIAQFIQFHPVGRGIILDLKAKERVMEKMSNTDPEVAKQALLCVQKILLSSKYVSYMK